MCVFLCGCARVPQHTRISRCTCSRACACTCSSVSLCVCVHVPVYPGVQCVPRCECMSPLVPVSILRGMYIHDTSACGHLHIQVRVRASWCVRLYTSRRVCAPWYVSLCVGVSFVRRRRCVAQKRTCTVILDWANENKPSRFSADRGGSAGVVQTGEKPPKHVEEGSPPLPALPQEGC